MKKIAVIALIVGLAGCQDTPSRGELLTNRTAATSKDDAVCRSYGAQHGTDVYIQCRTVMAKRRYDFRSEPVGICNINMVGTKKMLDCY
jgi:hypothetical protein